MVFTPDRLLLLAVVMTLVAADGVYRGWKQRKEGRIGSKLFGAFTALLVLGSGLAWLGFIQAWMNS